MLDKFKVFSEHWYVFIPLLAVIIALYAVETFVKNGKVKKIAGLVNLAANTALFVLSVIFGAPQELTLLLLLVSVLAAVLI